MAHPNPIPDRLKAARTYAGITQKELGIRIGMEPSSASGRMNHYEKGRHTPDIDTLKRMADELGVPINYFFCENETNCRVSSPDR
uniref:helix-turn-helix domain-containing protein n=1 Tax=Enterobacter cloacae complex sp. 280C5 TaxID=3395861 RepID=UPI003CEF4F08